MDVKPILIKIDGHTLLAFRDTVVEGQMSTKGFDKLLRRLLIKDAETSKLVGCVVFYVGLLASYSWNSDEATEYGKEENEEFAFANLLPHLSFNFEHLKDTFDRGSTCLIFTFDKDRDVTNGDKINYTIQLKDSFFKTAQNIVFPEGINKKDIETEILQILLNSLEENPNTYMLFEELQASIPLTKRSLVFHLNLLKEDDKVDFISSPNSDPPKIISVKIKSKGIKVLDGAEDTALQSPHIVKNIGVNIENITTQGDNSPINITVGDINTAFANITKQIEESKFDNKKEVLVLMKELQQELSGNKNPQKVKGIMARIKGKAAWVYNLIFKNPVLTAYLTQLLLKTI